MWSNSNSFALLGERDDHEPGLFRALGPMPLR